MTRALLNAARSVARKCWPRPSYEPSPEWQALEAELSKAQRVVDLGCGARPHPKATVAVDAFLEPEHRTLGAGPVIDPNAFEKSNVRFVQADIANLPFADKEFDFAYSHHVFEHLPDPKKACAEMCRIARAGAIITPSIFSEVAFGRPYHLWLVIARKDTLLFIQKTDRENCQFGDHPVPRKNGRYSVASTTNPFDILLNDGRWYWGLQRMPRLSRLLRKFWYSHSPVTEVVFLWKGTFNCLIVHEDGGTE
jgi:SAM-dependent methyltransferase